MHSVILLFSAFLILVYFLNKLISNRRFNNERLKSKITMLSWLEMSRDQRNSINAFENKQTMERKKLLLSQIRNEYRNVKNNISKTERPPFSPS